MSEKHIEELIIRYIEGDCPDGSMKELLEWVRKSPGNRDLLFGMKELHDRSRLPSDMTQQEIDEGWERLVAECRIPVDMHAGAQKPTLVPLCNPKRRNPLRRMKIAAAVVAVLIAANAMLLAVYMMEDRAKAMHSYTSADSIRTVVLPDGSKVKMNEKSTILFADNFNRRKREVYLVGEALFDVQVDKKRPFVVRSASMSVTALGTSFNVNAYPESNYIIASLITGKIDVSNRADDSSFILEPGQQVVYNIEKTVSEVTHGNPDDVTAWTELKIIFHDATMDEIFSALERRYGTTFLYRTDLFGDDRYNIKLCHNTTIYEVLSTLNYISGGFSFTIDDDVCRITR